MGSEMCIRDRPETLNPEPETSNPEPETWNLEPEELDPITDLTSFQETEWSKQIVWTIPRGRYKRCRAAGNKGQSSKPVSIRRKWREV